MIGRPALQALAALLMACGARSELQAGGGAPDLGAGDANFDGGAPATDAADDGAAAASFCDKLVRGASSASFCGLDACPSGAGDDFAERVARCVVDRCLGGGSFCGQVRLDLGGADGQCAAGEFVDSRLGNACFDLVFSRSRWPCLRGPGRVYFPDKC